MEKKKSKKVSPLAGAYQKLAEGEALTAYENLLVRKDQQRLDAVRAQAQREAEEAADEMEESLIETLAGIAPARLIPLVGRVLDRLPSQDIPWDSVKETSRFRLALRAREI